MESRIYHESVERLHNILDQNTINYIANISAIDYYDKFEYICRLLHEKFKSDTRMNAHHICAFIRLRDGKIYIGENSVRKIPGVPVSTHAEMDVMRKIMKYNTGKKKEKFDVLVLKISKIGKIGLSRPCYHCISSMISNSIINIKNIYYSTYNGRIIREKLIDMLDSELTRVSTGWRQRISKKRNYMPQYFEDKDRDKDNDTDSSESISSSDNSGSNNIRIFDPITGERKLITEKLLNKNINIKLNYRL